MEVESLDFPEDTKKNTEITGIRAPPDRQFQGFPIYQLILRSKYYLHHFWINVTKYVRRILTTMTVVWRHVVW
jgi:hypothetical protein